MKHKNRKSIFASWLSCCLVLALSLSSAVNAQVEVDINFDLRHVIGGEDTFNREKYIVIHADATESDYNSATGLSLLDELLTTYDAHYGRETGRMRFLGDNMTEDAARPGFANPDRVAELGQLVNDGYASNTGRFATEFKGRTIIAAQERPFFPNGQMTSPVPFETTPAVPSFAYSTTNDPNDPDDFGTATGEFMGLFLREAYGDGGLGTGPDGSLVDGKIGAPRPTWVEVINEPFFPLIDFAPAGEETTVDEIFELHRSVAREVKAVNPNALVGGFTNAFPDLEWRTPTDNKLFSQWDERWRRFIDEVGEDMDFYSIHLYDFHSIGGGNLNNSGTVGGGVTPASREILRKGGNIEATLDMIEHYNTIVYGEVKPWLISEYGAQLNDFYSELWSPQRDWFILKSFSSMMMQFMERPDVIEKTVPFVLARADFLFGNVVPDRVYPWRMLRGPNEPAELDRDNLEQAVFTEVVKFYQLWSDVNGTRVDTISTDLDLMVDAYVDAPNSKAYVILNSLDKAELTVNLNELGIDVNDIASVNIKHLYAGSDGSPQLDDDDFAALPASVTVGAEATMVVEYTFSSVPTIDETSTEEKIYATTYNQEIRADQTITFTIPGVTVGTEGEAVLRMGLGRDSFLSRTPVVLVNDNPVIVPADYRGDTQLERDVFPLGENVFFSMLEIPVPYAFLQTGDNEVKVTFPDGSDDNSGAVSSLALQKFDFTRAVSRTAASPILDDRERTVTWVNRDDYIGTNDTLPRFELGSEENFEINYATGIANNTEEDLTYIAVQVRQLDDAGEEVGTSEFVTPIPDSADNTGTARFAYTIPTNFATRNDGTEPFTDAIPETGDLPPGHSLLLLLFMGVDNATQFADANSDILIGAAPASVETRVRSISIDNISQYIPQGGSIPEVAIGQTLNVIVTYATGVENFIEEDLFYVATQVRQEDESGQAVANSAFTTVVADSGMNADTVSYNYQIPATFEDGNTPIPETADLPPGHQLRLITFLSANADSAFVDANTDIIIGNATDNGPPSGNRARSLVFDNLSDLIPQGETLPRVDKGDVITVNTTYSTAIINNVEEDLTYVAMQVRQFDEMNQVVNTSEFFTGVSGDDPNMATTSFSYEIPATFEGGDEILDNVDLPAGHRNVLIFFMAVDGASGFLNADTDIIIGDLPVLADRTRQITFDNIADFIPQGESLPRVNVGDTLNLDLSYQTGVAANTEEDLTFVAVQVRQTDETGGVVATSAFEVAVDGNSANIGTADYSYTIPSNFVTGVDNDTPFTGAIPDTVDLPQGHSLNLLIFMAVEGGLIANADTPIVIGDLPVIADRTRSITVDNIASFIPNGETMPRVDFGDVLDLEISYQTGAASNVEEDLTFVAVQVRQLNENNEIVGTSEFITAVEGTAANTGTANFSYTVPSNFALGPDNVTPFTDPIPNSASLPQGHSLLLLVFMGVEGGALSADANTQINIGQAAVPPTPEPVDDELCFPIKAKNGNIAVVCL